MSSALARSGSSGGVNVTVGLSSVGPPPVTSSSQSPSSCITHDVPPYSRYGVAPRTFVYQSRDRSTLDMTSNRVSSMSSVGNAPTDPTSFALLQPASSTTRARSSSSNHGPVPALTLI